MNRRTNVFIFIRMHKHVCMYEFSRINTYTPIYIQSVSVHNFYFDEGLMLERECKSSEKENTISYILASSLSDLLAPSFYSFPLHANTSPRTKLNREARSVTSVHSFPPSALHTISLSLPLFTSLIRGRIIVASVSRFNYHADPVFCSTFIN